MVLNATSIAHCAPGASMRGQVLELIFYSGNAPTALGEPDKVIP
jgi:hypothetical protein